MIAFLYLLMKAKSGGQRKEFSLKSAFPLYSSVTMEVTLLGKGKCVPSPESQGMSGISQPSLYSGPTLDP